MVAMASRPAFALCFGIAFLLVTGVIVLHLNGAAPRSDYAFLSVLKPTETVRDGDYLHKGDPNFGSSTVLVFDNIMADVEGAIAQHFPPRSIDTPAMRSHHVGDTVVIDPGAGRQRWYLQRNPPNPNLPRYELWIHNPTLLDRLRSMIHSDL